MPRGDGRGAADLRPVRIAGGYLPYAEGSALIEMGDTRVICAATVEETVPPFRKGRGLGWVTAEYRMLPRATLVRTPREGVGNPPTGRTHEIQRLIGRSLRAAVDFAAMGERMVTVDCDVLQADGGTRTAAITGGYVALVLALRKLQHKGVISSLPLTRAVAAVSAGIVAGEAILDLRYDEDSQADVDCNVVMTDRGDLVEFQATSEKEPFTRSELDRLLDLAGDGIASLLRAQNQALGAG